MGGSGSGSWSRCSAKSRTFHYNDLNINRLVSQQVIQDKHYCSGLWQWLRNGEVKSSVGYTVDTNDPYFPYIQLKYTNTKTNEEYSYKVRLTTATPNYGGKRWWFICPARGCGRRVAILYGGSTIFACRKCYNLCYESQNEARHYRILSKAQKIHRKLGGSGCTMDLVFKPKGMHWKTYEKLIAEMKYYDNISLHMLAKVIGYYK